MSGFSANSGSNPAVPLKMKLLSGPSDRIVCKDGTTTSRFFPKWKNLPVS